MRAMALGLLSILLGCSTAPSPEISPRGSVAATHLDEAIEVIRTNALFRDSVDWGRVREEARSRIGSPGTTTQAAYPAIRYVLRSLGDRHSFLQLSDSLRLLEARHVRTTPVAEGEGDVPAPSPYGSRMNPEARILVEDDARLGFVFLPQGRRDDAFATRFAAMVDSVARADVCGWIVDLRGNGGGDMWPMLAGIGSLLGEGEAGGWVFADGSRERYYYRNGRGIVLDTTGAERVRSTASNHPPPLSRDVSIAVLIDGGTASSGEVMAIAFRGRPNTRLFGEPTYGATTATGGFRLSDGANLVLAVATLIDTRGRTYVRHVPPDVQVSSGSTIPALSADAAVDEAGKWLSGTASCRGRSTSR